MGVAWFRVGSRRICGYGAPHGRNGTPSAIVAKGPGGRGDGLGHRPALRYWQVGNLNDAMRVLQLNVPFAFRYSVVKKNVQSSSGSSVIDA